MLPKPHEITTPTNKLVGNELSIWVAHLELDNIESDGKDGVKRVDGQWVESTYYSPTHDDVLFVRLLKRHKIALYPLPDLEHGGADTGAWYWTAIAHENIGASPELWEGNFVREPTQMRRVQFTGATPELAVLRCYIGMTRPEYKPLPPKCLE
jgi:hypothetical protein